MALVASPLLGTALASVHPQLAGMRRRLVDGFERYLIFYRWHSATKTLEVVRILPGERDVVSMLAGGG